MNSLANLSKDDIKYVCSAIPFQVAVEYFRKNPREFSKLKPGFRVKSLTDETAARTLYDFRNKDFVSSFLIKNINKWIETIDRELDNKQKNGINEEETYIDVLSRSFFSGNASLFFKIKEIVKSDDYLMVMNQAVLYQSEYRKRESEMMSLLEKKHQKSVNNQEELRKRISEEEQETQKQKAKVAELKNDLEENKSQLKQFQEDNRRLDEEINQLKQSLKQTQDDEVWKTSEMQQKIDSLTSKLEIQNEEIIKYEATHNEDIIKINSAEADIETWRNQVRNREKQIFTYKAERATLLTEKRNNEKQIKELKEALEHALSVEKAYKERLSILSTEKETYQQKNRELEETLGLKDLETAAQAISKRYIDTDRKVPLCPDNMEIFDENYSDSLENIGFDVSSDGAIDFLNYIERIFFQGVPLLVRRGPGINLANCLANTLYGVPVATRLSYSVGEGVQRIREFLSDIPDRVVCIEGFIGNCNEMELVPVLEQHRNKIIILTYMYDKTLSFVPSEILSSVHYLNADSFSSLLRIKDIIEEPSDIKDPSDIKEVPFYSNNLVIDSRAQKIFLEIACECGIRKETAGAMADRIDDENHLDQILMFSLLPYVTRVLGENPYNCSKRLQRYAGEAGRSQKKELIMRWFG